MKEKPLSTAAASSNVNPLIMSSFRSSSRYNSSANRSSTQSDPSSSIDLTTPRSSSHQSPADYALVKSKSTNKNEQNFSAMVKKFMEKKSTKSKGGFVVPADVTSFIADDFKKNNSRGGGFGGLHTKLFGTKSKADPNKKAKALTDVKPINARTLSMVLRSERELLSQNKDQETQITHLNSMLHDKNREVDKLKDLCLKQREEIKALKSAILFPDVMNTQLQGLLEKQDSELKHAKQIIPTLQRQVTSLTDQLQCLAVDLAEVKADKYAVGGCYDSIVGSPRTPPTYDQEEATNSLELSSGDRTTTPGSPDDMFLHDLNPCLTPYAKAKSKEFEASEYHPSSYTNSNNIINNNTTRCHETGCGSYGRKLSKSSSDQQYVISSKSGKNFGRRSDENKYTYGIAGKHMHY